MSNQIRSSTLVDNWIFLAAHKLPFILTMDVLGFALQDGNGNNGDNNMVELKWWNVGFASLFIVVNCK
jgi:hypothetical protein